jgi:hypothetical protein
MDAYRGDQWRTIGLMNGMDPEAHLVVNAVFATLNTMQAQYLARNPKVQVFPRIQKYADAARPFSNLMNYLVQEAKLSRAWNAAMRDAFYRVGFVRVGYTPPPERFSAKNRRLEGHPSALDVPWMRRVAPWDIRIDPLAESWHADGDARWCEFISLATMDQLKGNPNITVPRDLQPTISKDRRNRDERRMQDPYHHEAGNLVELRTVYDIEERKWFQWSPGSDRNLRDPDDWPESLDGLEGLPYAMLALNEQQDDPCPLGFADVLWPLQVERNKVRTILNELTKRMRRIIVANRNAFTDDDQNKIADSDLVEVLFATGEARGAIEQIPIAGFDQTLLLYDQMIQEDIRETLGQSKMARGQRINVTSATEAASVAQGDDTLAARNQARIEEWLRDSIKLYAKVAQRSISDHIIVPVVTEEDAAAVMAGTDASRTVSPEMLQGDFLFEIEVGSTLPRSRQAEIAEAMAWMQAIGPFAQNASIPDAMVALAIAFNKDPRKALMNAQQIKGTQEKLAETAPTEEPGRSGGGGSIDPAALAALNEEGGPVQ